MHNAAAQSRARLFDRAERRVTGSDFSPLIDSFHLPFPDSVEDYISEPCELNKANPTQVRPAYDIDGLNRCPCHGNRFGHKARRRVSNASRNEYSAAIDCSSAAQYDHPEDCEDGPLLGTCDPILNLPSEISDLILSYLSPAALDAARHTSKKWRTRILSNTWILSSVLGVKDEGPPLDGSLSGKLSLRDLLKKSDCDSELPSTAAHQDVWRTRFRTRNLDFSLPSPPTTLTTPAFVAAARAGTQNGFLAFQVQDSSQDARSHMQSTLVIYRFDSAELPWYAGIVHGVEGEGALRFSGVREIKRHAEWVLEIAIGDTAGLYSLAAHEAFSNSDPRFSLKKLETWEKIPSLANEQFAVQKLNSPPESFHKNDQFWKVLAPLPPNGGLRHVCFSEGHRKHTEPLFLAEQTETCNIHVIGEIDVSEKLFPFAGNWQSKSLSNNFEGGNRRLTGTALLSRPRLNSGYRNVAVAPSIIKDGSVRAAIVWQTSNLEKPILELYIYDIPEAIFYEPCKSYNHDISGNISTTAESFNNGERLQPCRLIQGKRVTSLDQHMGGIHPSSPLYRHLSPQEIALGGLQFPHTTENQEAYPRNVQYQKCFVWGPATSEGKCTQVSLKVFDFSFADPQRLQSLFASGVGARKRLHNIALDSLHCACALHDDGFRIVIPDVTTIETSEPVIKRGNADADASSWLQNATAPKESLSLNRFLSSIWPRKSISTQDTSPNVGHIFCNDPLARQAALERRQEWLRGRIIGMKRAGLTDFEIAELWNMSAWTQYGQVRKPDGWRELGKVSESV